MREVSNAASSYLKPGIFVQLTASLGYSPSLGPSCLPPHLLLLLLLGFGIRAAACSAVRPKQALPILRFIFLLSHHKASMQWTTQPAWGQECCVSVHTEFSAYMQQVQNYVCLNAMHGPRSSERIETLSQSDSRLLAD